MITLFAYFLPVLKPKCTLTVTNVLCSFFKEHYGILDLHLSELKTTETLNLLYFCRLQKQGGT